MPQGVRDETRSPEEVPKKASEERENASSKLRSKDQFIPFPSAYSPFCRYVECREEREKEKKRAEEGSKNVRKKEANASLKAVVTLSPTITWNVTKIQIETMEH